MPDLDPSLLDFRPRGSELASKKDNPLVWNSQIESEPSIEIGREAPVADQRADYGEDDMHITLDLDFGQDDGPSIEMGRNAPPPLPMDDDLMGNDFASKDFGLDEGNRTRLSSQVPSLIEDRDERRMDEGDMLLDGGDEFDFDGNDAAAAPSAAPGPLRDSQSPLSSLPSDDLAERDRTHIQEEAPEDSPIRQATHKAKKRKTLQSDSVTMLTSDTIKRQQADRSAILKPPSFLPRDQMLLNLLNLQKKGGFVSSLIGEGPIKGLAPELRGVLSIEVVRKSGQLKRKRDSGPAGTEEAEAEAGEPSGVGIEIPEDETILARNDDDSVGDAAGGDDVLIDLPADEGPPPAADDEEIDDEDLGMDRFDETTAPLLHPMEQGAISQGTKHAVHLLRDKFGTSDASSPSKQNKTTILFQELLLERATSKADATKIFFETLVLATKDAIKVEQAEKEVGSNIRIRAKRGLWGAWAEKEAGGEIAGQDEDRQAVAVT